jgi:sporulation protein YlmC with PRC-barrel domain
LNDSVSAPVPGQVHCAPADPRAEPNGANGTWNANFGVPTVLPGGGFLAGDRVMTARRICWSVGALAALAAIIVAGSQVLQAQAQVVKQGSEGPAANQGLTNRTDDGEKRCKASDLIGMKVRGLTGDEKIGSISDVVLGQDGRIKYVAVSFGGFLGLGDKQFAVPFEAIDFVKVDNDAYARIDATEEALKQKEGFNKDKWPSEADRSFTSGKLHQETEAADATK